MSNIFAEQLNKLMGKDRKRIREDKKEEFEESNCPYFLYDFCPHELFTNTKADLGPCPKSHDQKQRMRFESIEESKQQKYPYADKYYRFLKKLIYDLNKRMEREEDKIDMKNRKNAEKFKEKNKTQIQTLNIPEQIKSAEKKIEEVLLEIEALGAQGLVTDAVRGLTRLEQLKTERESLLAGLKKLEESEADKKMSLCEVCGATLLAKDVDKRTITHNEGKLHQGYAKIREALSEYEKKYGDNSRNNDNNNRNRNNDNRDNRDNKRRKSREYENDRRDNNRDNSRNNNRNRNNNNRDNRDNRDNNRNNDRNRNNNRRRDSGSR